MSISMAMIAFGPNPKISTSSIQADLAEQWPSLPKAQSAEDDENTFSFQSTERTVDGEKAADIGPIKVTRMAAGK